jgi:hypothetical protein
VRDEAIDLVEEKEVVEARHLELDEDDEMAELDEEGRAEQAEARLKEIGMVLAKMALNKRVETQQVRIVVDTLLYCMYTD